MSPPGQRILRPVFTAPGQARIHYYDAAGTERLIGIEKAPPVAFEDALPAREIPSYAGQHHTPGKYWSATDDRFLGYESFLESKWMKLIDHDPQIIAISAQPFTIEATDPDGASWEHTPDLFARRRDGTALLLDVKHDERMSVPSVVRQAERTADLCSSIGWDYRMVGEPPPLRWATVSWLAAYRRPLGAGQAFTDALLRLAQKPVPIGQLVSFQDFPELARSVVFHLMWHHQLLFDPSRPLRDHTRVWATDSRSCV